MANQAKEEFIAAYGAITCPGADKLLEYITDKTDFMIAPASTRFHLSCEGGLALHSIHVYKRLRSLYVMEHNGANPPTSWQEKTLTPAEEETLAICGLLHDVCKAGCYKPGFRNVKQDDGSWQRVPTYTFEDPMPYGHGEKSVYIINGYMRLTREEAFAIRYHMGFSGNDNVRNVGKAFEMYQLAVLTHLADMEATYLDERD